MLSNKDARVGLTVPRAAPPRARVAAATHIGHDPLFERLRVLRKQIADENGVPPYVIFHDRVLREMIEQRPRKEIDLLRISGIGARKAAEFGATFLAEIVTYEDEQA